MPRANIEKEAEIEQEVKKMKWRARLKSLCVSLKPFFQIRLIFFCLIDIIKNMKFAKIFYLFNYCAYTHFLYQKSLKVKIFKLYFKLFGKLILTLIDSP